MLNRKVAYLRGHEFGCATESTGCLAVPHFLLAQSIVSYFDMAIKCQQDIVELQITGQYVSDARHFFLLPADLPIDNAIFVEVFKGKQNLGSVEFSLSERELFPLDV
jgi:hypothetical protein